MASLNQYRPSLRRIIYPLVHHPPRYRPENDPLVQKTHEQERRMDRLLEELRVIKERPHPPTQRLG